MKNNRGLKITGIVVLVIFGFLFVRWYNCERNGQRSASPPDNAGYKCNFWTGKRV